MRRLNYMMTVDGEYHLQSSGESHDEVCISFIGGWRLERRKQVIFDEGALEANQIEWIWSRGADWYIDFDLLKQKVDVLQDLEWLKGVSLVSPEVDEGRGIGLSGIPSFSALRFYIYREEFVSDRKRKLFLSHKGSDKAIVRSFFKILRALGFDPWLDEHAMVAGEELERALLDGFDQSCAAIFFVTPRFNDEHFLATEVNYAISEKRKKGNRFSIITIVLSDETGKGTVPPLLKQYVWKEPEDNIEALVEILRALPIKLGEASWRAGIAPA